MAEKSSEKINRKLVFEDRFQPAKRNLIWVCVITVAIAIARPTVATKPLVSAMTAEDVKIPGLDLSLGIIPASVLLLIAATYCFVEYWLEYQTAKKENCEAIANQDDVSLSEFFTRQRLAIETNLQSLTYAGTALNEIPSKIGAALTTWQGQLSISTHGEKTRLYELTKELSGKLYAELQGNFEPELIQNVQNIVYSQVFQPIERDWRSSAQYHGRNPFPHQPPLFSDNTMMTLMQSDLTNLVSGLTSLESQQSILARDFNRLNSKLYSSQQWRFKLIDGFAPHAAYIVAVTATLFSLTGFVPIVEHAFENLL